jgi:glutamate decarboxylase
VALLDDIHACADLPVVKPKQEMTERKYHPRNAFAMVRDELMLDGNSRRNLAPPIHAPPRARIHYSI